MCSGCKRARPASDFRGTNTTCIACLAKRNLTPVKLKRLKANATSRSIEIALADDQLVAFFDRECAYCGHVATEGDRNGVDRVDNAKGYVPGNCVTCCGWCNKMKYALDGRTFVERACHVSAHHGGSGLKSQACWSEPVHPLTMKRCAAQAAARGIAFELTPDQFKALAGPKLPCHYCGRLPTHKNHGIDRLDSGAGYVADNCVTACGDCNIAKCTQTAQEFVERCKAIAARAATILDTMPPDMPRNLNMRKKRVQPVRDKCARCQTVPAPRNWRRHPRTKDGWYCRNCYLRIKRALSVEPSN